MNPQIEKLRTALSSALSNVTTTLDQPSDPENTWLLDVLHEGRLVVVEWDPKKKVFGVSLSEDGEVYGEDPDWASSDFNKTLGTILRMLTGDD